MKEYKLIRNLPVARFFYQGAHTHPVRRTIVLIETTTTYIRGYELREGNKTRDFKSAPIKTYRKSKIATVKQLDKRTSLRSTKRNSSRSTLVRASIVDLLKSGI